MKKKLVTLLMAAVLFMTPVRAEAKSIDLSEEGFHVMSTTAYCQGEITYTGHYVRPGIAAVDKAHIGYTAIIYTLDGKFLGYYECLDTGGSKGIVEGNVIDVYRCDLNHCKTYMQVTGGKVWVKYIWAEG